MTRPSQSAVGSKNCAPKSRRSLVGAIPTRRIGRSTENNESGEVWKVPSTHTYCGMSRNRPIFPRLLKVIFAKIWFLPVAMVIIWLQ